ncbi:hypothetical protein ANCCAN_01968 [Ancylostoma caninum]|uniref:Uncharacterized protein n=1 Tax=Ancylostoma caninum TaxID=29170 RepID=A0A368H952_ANCCA|nr:hypothetical protein ANCCAN_01968 [Ancylostoma caninum]
MVLSVVVLAVVVTITEAEEVSSTYSSLQSAVTTNELFDDSPSSGEDIPSGRICDMLTQEDVEGPPHILGGIPNVLMIYNDTDAESLDIACILRAVAPNIAGTRIIDKPCMQLLTIEAVPEEIHVIITRGDYKTPFCDAQVYGAIPSVIEVRITTSNKVEPTEYFTINMITNGGHLRLIENMWAK